MSGIRIDLVAITKSDNNVIVINPENFNTMNEFGLIKPYLSI